VVLTHWITPVAAAPAANANSPSGPPVVASPAGAIKIGIETSNPKIFDFVFTVPTFFIILGLNHIFCHQFLFASLVRLSFDAPEMNAQLFALRFRLAASSKSLRLRIAARGVFSSAGMGGAVEPNGADQPAGAVETSSVPTWSD
jgi:hypothetical protein